MGKARPAFSPMNDEFRFASYDAELRRQIIAFHKKPDQALVIPILKRIVQHYLPKHSTITAENVMEDAFGTTFTDEELRHLKSFSEITSLIDQKVKALSGSSNAES